MKLLKWIGIGLGAFVLLIAVATGAILLNATLKLDDTYEVTAQAIAVPDGEQAVAWGEHVMEIHACQECHGMDLAGQVWLDIPPGRIVASNLTRGAGGVGRLYDGSFQSRWRVEPR